MATELAKRCAQQPEWVPRTPSLKFQRVCRRVATDVILLPVLRWAFCVMHLERFWVVPAFVAKNARSASSFPPKTCRMRSRHNRSAHLGQPSHWHPLMWQLEFVHAYTQVLNSCTHSLSSAPPRNCVILRCWLSVIASREAAGQVNAILLAGPGRCYCIC